MASAPFNQHELRVLHRYFECLQWIWSCILRRLLSILDPQERLSLELTHIWIRLKLFNLLISCPLLWALRLLCFCRLIYFLKIYVVILFHQSMQCCSVGVFQLFFDPDGGTLSAFGVHRRSYLGSVKMFPALTVPRGWNIVSLLVEDELVRIPQVLRLDHLSMLNCLATLHVF